MTTFDWADYGSLAQKLRVDTDEASQRTAISRLYYSVFHQARLYLEGEGVIFSTMGPGSHQQVWKEFQQRGRSHRAIGSLGGQLQKYRVQADYFDQIGKLDEVVKDSFKNAEISLTYLKQILSAKNPDQS